MPRHTHTAGPLTVHQSTGRHVYKQQRLTNVKDSTPTGNAKGHMNVASDEVQRITLLGGPTGGSFDVDFEATGTPTTIAFDDTAAEVTTALLTLTSLAAGDIVVTGDDGGPWTITFMGTKAFTDVDLIALDSNSLTGGNNVSVVIEEIIPGQSGQLAPENAPGDSSYGLTEQNINLDTDEAGSPTPTRLILDSGTVTVPSPPTGAEENTRKYHRGVSFSGRIPFEL